MYKRVIVAKGEWTVSNSSPKIRYYHRASGVDRLTFLLLTISCIALVILQTNRSNTKSDCAECLRLVKLQQQQAQQAKAQQQAQQVVSSLPSTTTSTTPPPPPPPTLWKNKYNVVHVLWTRFMQLQPDLIALGKARIELFKTFTLRSMREQSTQEYLWIIMTDPELEAELAKEMIDLIKIHPHNIVLLGMNTGGVLDFRHSGWMGAIEDVLAGNMQLVKDYQQAAQTRIYVETRIDADDSMFSDYMCNVQRQASQSLRCLTTSASASKAIITTAPNNNDNQKSQKQQQEQPQFRVFCPEHHLEWGYFNPWQQQQKNVSSNNKGHMFGITSPKFCITAGLTYAFDVGTKPNSIKIPHHLLHKQLPQCNNNKTMTTVVTTNCISRIDAGMYKYVILRSRTPTSAGMAGVIPSNKVQNSKEWASQQDFAWTTYPLRNFGISPSSIWTVRAYLSQHMEYILKDALAGQCTRADFTCKRSSQQDLKTLLLQVQQHDGNSGNILTTSNSNHTKIRAQKSSPTVTSAKQGITRTTTATTNQNDKMTVATTAKQNVTTTAATTTPK